MKKLVVIFAALLIVFSPLAFAKAERSYTKPESRAASVYEASASASVPEDGLKSDGKLHVYLVGDGEMVRTPSSSFIDYITYYAASGHLIICMNGKDYVFANVEESTWNAFKDAESKGEFYGDTFKDETKYHVNDYDGSNGSLIVMEYLQ